MNDVVVVEVVTKIGPGQLTVVIIGVHLFGNWLVQVLVQEA